MATQLGFMFNSGAPNTGSLLGLWTPNIWPESFLLLSHLGWGEDVKMTLPYFPGLVPDS